MSWDIILFNTTEQVADLDELDEVDMTPIDFNSVFEKHFKEIKKDDKYREIVGKDFTITYSMDDEPSTNFMLNLYGENGLYEVIHLAKQNGWQIFDTGNGEMLDLDDPSNNGYDDFQNYLKNIQGK